MTTPRPCKTCKHFKPNQDRRRQGKCAIGAMRRPVGANTTLCDSDRGGKFWEAKP